MSSLSIGSPPVSMITHLLYSARQSSIRLHCSVVKYSFVAAFEAVARQCTQLNRHLRVTSNATIRGFVMVIFISIIYSIRSAPLYISSTVITTAAALGNLSGTHFWTSSYMEPFSNLSALPFIW